MNECHYRFQVSILWLFIATWLFTTAFLYLLGSLVHWLVDWREKK